MALLDNPWSRLDVIGCVWVMTRTHPTILPHQYIDLINSAVIECAYVVHPQRRGSGGSNGVVPDHRLAEQVADGLAVQFLGVRDCTTLGTALEQPQSISHGQADNPQHGVPCSAAGYLGISYCIQALGSTARHHGNPHPGFDRIYWPQIT